MVAAVGADQHAAALGQARDAEGREEGVQDRGVIGVLHVLDIELPVVGQGLHEAAHDADRPVEHALQAAQHLAADILLDRRRVGRQRGEHQAAERRGAQLPRAEIVAAEILGHAAHAVDAALEGDAAQVAGKVVAPGVVDAAELVADVAAVVEGDQRAAMRAAVLEAVDRAVGPAHRDHRHDADMVGAIVALVGDVRFQADEVPGRGLEQALHLALVVGLVLVDPVGHAGQGLLRPDAVRDGLLEAFVVSDVHANLLSLQRYIGRLDDAAPARFLVLDEGGGGGRRAALRLGAQLEEPGAQLGLG